MLSALARLVRARVDTAQRRRARAFARDPEALAAAGGSAAPAAGSPVARDPARCWPLAADPRFQAVMGMAIGQQPISLGVNYQAIRCRPCWSPARAT